MEQRGGGGQRAEGGEPPASGGAVQLATHLQSAAEPGGEGETHTHKHAPTDTHTNTVVAIQRSPVPLCQKAVFCQICDMYICIYLNYSLIKTDLSVSLHPLDTLHTQSFCQKNSLGHKAKWIISEAVFLITSEVSIVDVLNCRLKVFIFDQTNLHSVLDFIDKSVITCCIIS